MTKKAPVSSRASVDFVSRTGCAKGSELGRMGSVLQEM